MVASLKFTPWTFDLFWHVIFTAAAAMLCTQTDEELEAAAQIYPNAWSFDFFAHDTHLQQVKHLLLKGRWMRGSLAGLVRRYCVLGRNWWGGAGRGGAGRLWG
jgi:hypothetical protein